MTQLLSAEQIEREFWRRTDIEDANRQLERAYLARHGRNYVTPSGNTIPLYYTNYSDPVVESAIQRLMLGSHAYRCGDLGLDSAGAID
jgi:hypothetical protein